MQIQAAYGLFMPSGGCHPATSFPLNKGDPVNGRKAAFHTSRRGIGLENVSRTAGAAPARCAALKRVQGRPTRAASRPKMQKFTAETSCGAQKPKFGGLGVCRGRSARKFNWNSVFPYFSVLFPYFFRISVLFPYFFRILSAASPCGISVFPYFFRTFSVLFPRSVSASDFRPKMGFRAAASPQEGQHARPVARPSCNARQKAPARSRRGAWGSRLPTCCRPGQARVGWATTYTCWLTRSAMSGNKGDRRTRANSPQLNQAQIKTCSRGMRIFICYFP